MRVSEDAESIPVQPTNTFKLLAFERCTARDWGRYEVFNVRRGTNDLTKTYDVPFEQRSI
jgi:hypothetical protein